MIKNFQKTIVKPIFFKGVGLHSGKETELKVLPGREGGIVFKRVDLANNNLVIANYKNE